MHVILLALGLVGAVAGVGLIVLNPPIDAIRLSHTLLIVGAIAIAGGALLIAVAAANRQLRRIAQLLDTRSQPRAAGAPASSETPLGLAPLVDAPSTPAPVAAPTAPPSPVPDLHATSEAAFQSVVLDPALHEAPAAPPVPPQKPGSIFDTLWASPSRQTKDQRAPEPAVEAPRVDKPPPDVAASQDGETATIFKSGVIDGMAYTLYTDGSIEAEMPGGTVRFATVDDLRAYLDEHT